MPYVKNTEYANMPFSTETSRVDFYTYSSPKDLAIKCESSQYEVTRCRTVGILRSDNGKFFLTELDSKDHENCPLVRLSMIYLKKQIPSTVIPYPVQVFGFLQWKNRPVIYVKILQVLSVPIALKLRDAMNGIASSHLAKCSINPSSDDEVSEDLT